jgi:hypothetical protein
MFTRIDPVLYSPVEALRIRVSVPGEDVEWLH